MIRAGPVERIYPDAQDEFYGGELMKMTLIVAVAISVVTALFALQNMQHAQVTFLGCTLTAPW